MNWPFIFLVFVSTSCHTYLSGELKTLQDEPMKANGTVNITSLKKSPPISTTAQVVQGQFETEDSLPEGTYLIEALVPGYQIHSTKIDLSSASHIDLKMTPLKKPNIKGFKPHLTVPADKGTGAASLLLPNF